MTTVYTMLDEERRKEPVPDSLCSRSDFEQAKSLITRYFHDNPVSTRSQLSSFKYFGLPYEAIELAYRKLLADGVLEELYTLPPAPGTAGKRRTYVGLTTALEARAVELPPSVVRLRKALQLMGD